MIRRAAKRMSRILRSEMRQITRRVWVGRFGSIREKEEFSLLSRPHFAYGLRRAADHAKFFGKSRVIACEFGVANGGGLLNLMKLS